MDPTAPRAARIPPVAKRAEARTDADVPASDDRSSLGSPPHAEAFLACDHRALSLPIDVRHRSTLTHHPGPERGTPSCDPAGTHRSLELEARPSRPGDPR